MLQLKRFIDQNRNVAFIEDARAELFTLLNKKHAFCLYFNTYSGFHNKHQYEPSAVYH